MYNWYYQWLLLWYFIGTTVLFDTHNFQKISFIVDNTKEVKLVYFF